MNLNIAEMNNKNNSGVSINIKDNTGNGNTAINITGAYAAAKTEKAAYVTRGIQDKDKLDNNTYSSLIKEADDIKEQLKISADTAKSSLKALFIRLSGVDAVKMDEEGFNLTDATPQQCVNIVEKIKIELAMHADGAVADTSNISKDKIEQVAGSAGYANEIAQRLSGAGMPVTDENIKSVQGVLDKTEGLSKLSCEDKKNIVRSNVAPTVDNVYKIQHISGFQKMDVDNISYNLPHGGKDNGFEQLRPQIENIISQAGFEVNEDTLNMAKDLLNNDIPMTSDSFRFMNELDNMTLPDLSDEGERMAYIDRIVDNMAAGCDAGSVSLTDSDSVMDKVMEALDVINKAEPAHVKNVLDNTDTFCIGNLKQAIKDINQAWDNYMSESAGNNGADSLAYSISIMQNNTDNTGTESDKTYSCYNRLQELRMLMTAQAGAFLVKQGVNLNTIPIAELTNKLYEYDRQIFEEEYADIGNVDRFGVNDNNIQNSVYVNISDNVLVQQQGQIQMAQQLYQTSLSVRRAMYNISTSPDALIGAVLKKQSDSKAVTIQDFAGMGSNLKRRFKEAGQTYESVGTQVRQDLGDSVKKAVAASTDDILKELGLENTTANKDAIRILALNSMDMTTENVDNIKSVYQTLNSLINNMTPKTVLNMIKDNINPLKDDINDLNEYIQKQNEINGTDESKSEKYSLFLYKLDKTDGISLQDREKFIGIYKMLNIFTKDAGAAVGALIKQDAQVTMGNLYTAYKSRKAYGMQAAVDDSTGISKIHADYYNNLFEQTSGKITPLTLKDVNNSQDIYSRSVEGFCEAVSESYDFDKEAEYYSDIYDKYIESLRYDEQDTDYIIGELERADETVTIGNIQAAFNVSQTDYFNNLKNKLTTGRDNKTDGNDYDDELSGMFKEITDSLKDSESIDKAYDNLKQNIQKRLNEAVADDNMTSADAIETLRNANKEIGYIYRLNLRHDYKIPVVIGDDIRTINLTLIQDDTDKGRISVGFDDEKSGHVSVEAKINNKSADIYILSDNDDTALIEDRAQNLSEELKNKMQIDTVNINTGINDNINRVTYDNAAESVASDKLYKISKLIIMKMSGK